MYSTYKKMVNIFFTTCFGDIVLEGKARYRKFTSSNPLHISMGIYLKLCTYKITPLPLHLNQIAKKSKATFAFPSVS